MAAKPGAKTQVESQALNEAAGQGAAAVTRTKWAYSQLKALRLPAIPPSNDSQPSILSGRRATRMAPTMVKERARMAAPVVGAAASVSPFSRTRTREALASKLASPAASPSNIEKRSLPAGSAFLPLGGFVRLNSRQAG